MRVISLLLVIVVELAAIQSGQAQSLVSDVAYVENGHSRHKLDIYSPQATGQATLPVVFWIHGGGWQAGDKSDVALKPKILTERGCLFVSSNYRLLPDVSMEELIQDLAKALTWVQKNIPRYKGDPQRIVVGGHSAGAQLAALLSVDHRYLAAEGFDCSALRGCIPVDGDTYDIPKIIMTAEHRQTLYGGKMFTFGHRQKFGNDPEKHVNFSAVTHITKGKNIPPFLILYFSGNPDTTAQAGRLQAALREANVQAVAIGKHDSNHSRLNDELGISGEPVTKSFLEFLDKQLLVTDRSAGQ